MGRRTRAFVSVLVFTTLTSSAFACSTQSQPPPPVSVGSDGIKVLTYNTRGLPRSKDQPGTDPDKMTFVEVLAKRVNEERPDVVLLQETCASQALRLQELLAVSR